MNFLWVYNIKEWQLLLLIVVLFVLIGVVGLLITEPSIKRWLGSPPSSNDLIANFLQIIGVFYGITLGLVSVATWGEYSKVDEISSKEASLLGCMYKGATAFPEPVRSEMKNEIKGITRYIIKEAWPIQQKGLIPEGGRTARLENILYNFQPKTENEKIIFSNELALFNSMIEARRDRKETITSGLPDVLYWVLFIGAAINICTTWFLVSTKKGLHIIITAMTSILIGSLIFLIITMDYPYIGKFSVTPEAYQLIYSDVMGG